jgi:hypothetical protein
MSDVRPEWVKSLSIVNLKPGDTLVIMCSHKIGAEGAQRLTEAFTHQFPGQRVILLDEGMELGVLRGLPEKS